MVVGLPGYIVNNFKFFYGMYMYHTWMDGLLVFGDVYILITDYKSELGQEFMGQERTV